MRAAAAARYAHAADLPVDVAQLDEQQWSLVCELLPADGNGHAWEILACPEMAVARAWAPALERRLRAAADFDGEVEVVFGDARHEPDPDVDLGRNDRCPCGSGLKAKRCRPERVADVFRAHWQVVEVDDWPAFCGAQQRGSAWGQASQDRPTPERDNRRCVAVAFDLAGRALATYSVDGGIERPPADVIGEFGVEGMLYVVERGHPRLGGSSMLNTLTRWGGAGAGEAIS